MDRRGFISTLGSIATVGCLGADRSQPSATETATRTEAPPGYTATPAPPPTTKQTTRVEAEEPTVRPTETPAGLAKRLDFGDWYNESDAAYAVLGLEKRTEFTHNFAYAEAEPGTYTMPTADALAIVDMRIKNIGNEAWPKSTPILGWAVVSNGALFQKSGGFAHPEFPDGVSFDWLTKPDYPRTGWANIRVESGEVVRRWWGTTIPRSMDVEEATVGHDGEFTDGNYGIRWGDWN